MPTFPLTIWTLRSQLENGYSIAQHCPECHERRGEVDIAGLIAAGHGEKPIRDLRLKCHCGTRLEFVIQPPSRHLKTLPP